MEHRIIRFTYMKCYHCDLSFSIYYKCVPNGCYGYLYSKPPKKFEQIKIFLLKYLDEMRAASNGLHVYI